MAAACAGAAGFPGAGGGGGGGSSESVGAAVIRAAFYRSAAAAAALEAVLWQPAAAAGRRLGGDVVVWIDGADAVRSIARLERGCAVALRVALELLGVRVDMDTVETLA